MATEQPSQISSSLVAELPTGHSCVLVSPAVVADRPPLALDKHLHASFFLIFSIHQSDGKTWVGIPKYQKSQTSKRSWSVRDFVRYDLFSKPAIKSAGLGEPDESHIRFRDVFWSFGGRSPQLRGPSSWDSAWHSWMREAARCGRAHTGSRGHPLGDAQSGVVLTQSRPVSLAAKVAGQSHVLPMAAVMCSPRPPGALQEAALLSRAADVIQPHGPRVLLKGVHSGPPAMSVGKAQTLRRAAAPGFQQPRQPQHRTRPDWASRLQRSSAASYPRPRL